MESNPSALAQAAEVATQKSNVVSSVMGRQAPLGHHPGAGPVQLPTETRGSNWLVSGSVRCRQQSVGDFETEILGDNVEGVDDTENRRPAQCSRMQLSGTHCRKCPRCRAHRACCALPREKSDSGKHRREKINSG